MPADGYYEWKKDGKFKQPYHITLTVPFSFAGLWETWSKKGPAVATFTIVTTTAGDGTRALHDREPVMLRCAQWAAWLDPEAAPDGLLAMIRPVPAELVRTQGVSRTVNNVRNDGPECLEPNQASLL